MFIFMTVCFNNVIFLKMKSRLNGRINVKISEYFRNISNCQLLLNYFSGRNAYLPPLSSIQSVKRKNKIYI